MTLFRVSLWAYREILHLNLTITLESNFTHLFQPTQASAILLPPVANTEGSGKVGWVSSLSLRTILVDKPRPKMPLPGWKGQNPTIIVR